MTEPNILELANRSAVVNAGDYVQDDLLHCGKCHTPKQCKVVLFDTLRRVQCLCACQSQAVARQLEEERDRQELERISRLRSAGLQDRSLQQCSFAMDDGKRPQDIAKAKRYCQNWPEMYRQNIGLLLWGDVGTGKSFLAACIASELLSRHVPVLMTNFARLSNGMQTGWGEERNEYIRSLNAYKLLIIDDLGAERESDAMQEQVFQVIDSRYRNRQPVIITTNLTLDDIKKPRNMQHKRIYDRVLEMTAPIKCEGESRRKAIHSEKRQAAARMILEEE